MLRLRSESPITALSHQQPARVLSLFQWFCRWLGVCLTALVSSCAAFEDPGAPDKAPISAASTTKPHSSATNKPVEMPDAEVSQSLPSASVSVSGSGSASPSDVPSADAALPDSASSVDVPDAASDPDTSVAPSANPPDSSLPVDAGDAGVEVDAALPPVLWSNGLPIPDTVAVARPSGTPGNLKVINWAGFKAAVTYTFDDSNSSQIAHYFEMNALGVPFTFYLQTGKSDSLNSVWGEALADGHELGNHTKSHLDMDDGTDTDEATEFIEETWGTPVYTMAAPFGASVYATIASTRFLINRNVADAQISPKDSTNPFGIPCYLPPQATKATTFNAKIDLARNAGRWQVILIHGFAGGSDGAYNPIDFSEFEKSVKYGKSKRDVWLDTVVSIGAYWRAQKLISGLSPVAAEESQVWSWTLPDHFPPGKYVRVTVDGGTLWQDGQELLWSEHGYYEVSLDAGSLVLSP